MRRRRVAVRLSPVLWAGTEAELPVTQGGAAAPATGGAAEQNPLSSAPANCHGRGVLGDRDAEICLFAGGGRQHVFGPLASQDEQVAHLVFGPLTTLTFLTAARRPLPCIPSLCYLLRPTPRVADGRSGAGKGTLAGGYQLL